MTPQSITFTPNDSIILITSTSNDSVIFVEAGDSNGANTNVPIASEGSLDKNNMLQHASNHTESTCGSRATESGSMESDLTLTTSNVNMSSKDAAWVVDISKNTKTDTSTKNLNDKIYDTLRASSKSGSNSEGCKSRGSVERLNHKF